MALKYGMKAFTVQSCTTYIPIFQDLLEIIKGLEAACVRLERERGESSTEAEGLQKDVDHLAKCLESAGAAAETTREEVQQKERQRTKVCTSVHTAAAASHYCMHCIHSGQ